MRDIQPDLWPALYCDGCGLAKLLCYNWRSRVSPDRHSGGGTVHRGGNLERALCIAAAWYLGLRPDLVRRCFVRPDGIDPDPHRGAFEDRGGDAHAAADSNQDGHTNADTFSYVDSAHANRDGYPDPERHRDADRGSGQGGTGRRRRYH